MYIYFSIQYYNKKYFNNQYIYIYSCIFVSFQKSLLWYNSKQVKNDNGDAKTPWKDKTKKNYVLGHMHYIARRERYNVSSQKTSW